MKNIKPSFDDLLTQLWNQYDTNKKGYLTKKEVKEMFDDMSAI